MLLLSAAMVLVAVLTAPLLMFCLAWMSLNPWAAPPSPEIPAQEQGANHTAESTTTPFSSPGLP